MRRQFQTTEDVERRYANPEAYASRQKAKSGRSRPIGAVILVVLGWVVMLWATAQPLLASIQALGIGLGLLLSAVIFMLWKMTQTR